MTEASGASTRKLAYAAWLAVCVIWGTTYLAIKICLETMPPMLMGGLRYTTAGLLLMGLLRVQGQALPARSSWRGLAMLGFLFLGLGNGGVIWAEQFVTSGLTAVLVATTPFWMVAIEAATPAGERLTARHFTGLVIGFLGIVLLVWRDLWAGGHQAASMAAGILALQIASMGWAMGSTYSRRHAREENALSAASMEMLFGGLILLAAGSALGEWGRLAFNPRTASAFVYLIIVGAVVGFASYIYALKHLPVSTVSLYAYVNPVIAVTLGSVLLAEPFDLRMAAAIAIILAGVSLVQSASRKSSGAARAQAEAA